MNDHRSDIPQFSANEIVRFQLTATITGAVPDRKAKGKLRYFVNGVYQLSTAECDFYDAEGDLDGVSGDKGRAIYCRDSSRFEILVKTC